MAFIMKFALVLVATLFLAGSVKAGQPVFDILSPLICKPGLTDQQITAVQKILDCLTKLFSYDLGVGNLQKGLLKCADLLDTSSLKYALTKVCKGGSIDPGVLFCLNLKVPGLPDKPSISVGDITTATTCLSGLKGQVPAVPDLSCPTVVLCKLGLKLPALPLQPDPCLSIPLMCL